MGTIVSVAGRDAAAGERVRPRIRRLDLGRVLVATVLVVLAAVWLVPFLFVVLTSVRSQGDLLREGPFSIPTELRFSNFARAWEVGEFSTYFRNSLLVTFTKVPLGIFIASLAAYPLAKLRFRFRDGVFLFFLLGLAIPIHVSIIPLFSLLRTMGLLNTLWALFPPYVAFGLPLQILIMRGWFRGLPDELREAALIDGASEWQIFRRIVLPLSVPALATAFIIDALATWNEFLIALVMLNAEKVRTVPLGLLNFQGQFSSSQTQLNAGILIGILPVLIVYLLFQRYLVSGLTAGAIKG
jgi:raffinose/stachyose/melibiose transport system permease protein